MRAAPGLYPVKEIMPNETGKAFLVLAGPYGVEPEDLEVAEEAFVDRINNVMRPDGYRLAGAFPPQSDIASGVVGFRLIRSNTWGDHLWIDDFVAAGLGANAEVMRLVHFLEDEAAKLGVTQIHIDVIPPELAEGPETVRRSFGDEVDDFAKEIEGAAEGGGGTEKPIDPSSPLGNRISASELGSLYVGQRHVFVIDPPQDETSASRTQRPPTFRPLGRPLPPRRGH